MSSITLKCSHCNNDFFSEGLDIYIANLKKENKSLEEKCQSLEERIVSDWKHRSESLTRLNDHHNQELSRERKRQQAIQSALQEDISHLQEKLSWHRGIIISTTLFSLYFFYENEFFKDFSINSFLLFSALWFSSFCFMHLLVFLDSLIKRFFKKK